MAEAPTSSDRALELVVLAERLKLTRLQADFVLALVAHPKRNQTKAAIEAGASPQTAVVWACKTLRLAKVQEFLGKVTEAAVERACERALASPAVRQVEEAIMASAEHLLRLSRLGRADIGRHLSIDQDGNVEVRVDPAYTEIIRELRIEERADKDGMPVRRTTIKVADPVPALQGLAKVRGWERAIPGSEVRRCRTKSGSTLPQRAHWRLARPGPRPASVSCTMSCRLQEGLPHGGMAGQD